MLRYLDPEDRMSNRVISDISVVLRETTLTVSDSIETSFPVKSEIVRVVSPSTTEIIKITRFKRKNYLQGPNTLNVMNISLDLNLAFFKSYDMTQIIKSAGDKIREHTQTIRAELHSTVGCTGLEKRRWLVRSLARPKLFPSIDESHCDRAYSSLSAVHCFDLNMWESSQRLKKNIMRSIG